MPCPVGTDIARAAGLLRAGSLVALPTETVYGLGADALDPAAVARVFEAKERPHFDPLIVHLADVSWLPRVVARWSDTARRLADAFWPGPLTLVLPKTEAVPDLVTSGLPTVAVRVPAHPMARELIRQAGTPVAAPSANRFGQISPTTAAHVLEQLGERIDYILDGGPCTVGVESTVLSLCDESGLDAPPALFRPGGLTLEEIEGAIGPVAVVPHTPRDGAAAPSPGMLTRHYAPRTPLTILEPRRACPGGEMTDGRPARVSAESRPRPPGGTSSTAETQSTIEVLPGRRDLLARVGLLTLTPPSDLSPFAATEVLSPTGDLREAATNFFAALRRLDAAGLDHIVATPFPEHGLGRALNDRLRRAAASS